VKREMDEIMQREILVQEKLARIREKREMVEAEDEQVRRCTEAKQKYQ
jgi:hypothetical protein